VPVIVGIGINILGQEVAPRVFVAVHGERLTLADFYSTDVVAGHLHIALEDSNTKRAMVHLDAIARRVQKSYILATGRDLKHIFVVMLDIEVSGAVVERQLCDLVAITAETELLHTD